MQYHWHLALFSFSPQIKLTEMEENSRQESANPSLLPVLKIIFHWNTAMPIHSRAAFTLHSRTVTAVTTGIRGPQTLKDLLSGSFKKRFVQPHPRHK